MPETAIQYSDKYYDNKYEYRHVILPPELAQSVPKNHLMTETEWRNLGGAAVSWLGALHASLT
ncbi:hypothetical protein MTO96_021445 [Rhipicephalus appendiculatus]